MALQGRPLAKESRLALEMKKTAQEMLI